MFENTKIMLLKEKVKIRRNAAHKEGRFSLFDAKFATDAFSKSTNYEYLSMNYEMISGWDEMCNLPYGVGVSLDRLANDSIVMVHRTRLNLDMDSQGLNCNEALHNIMDEGLMNFGHMNAVGGGAYSSEPPSLTLTMTPLKGISGYINLLGSYHDNDTTIIAAFPKELVDSEGYVNKNVSWDKVYDLSGDTPRVKREFMVGAILKKNNGLDEFYTRDEIVATYKPVQK